MTKHIETYYLAGSKDQNKNQKSWGLGQLGPWAQVTYYLYDFGMNWVAVWAFGAPIGANCMKFRPESIPGPQKLKKQITKKSNKIPSLLSAYAGIIILSY